MKKYSDTEEKVLQKVVCNCCGRELPVAAGFVREGLFEAKVTWGYFSGKDGETHDFDLCEDCYDRWIRSFAIPVSVETQTELL